MADEYALDACKLNFIFSSLKHLRLMRIYCIFFTSNHAQLSLIICFMLFQMFVVIAYFNVIKKTMTDFFPLGIIDIAQSYVSVKRIQVP